MTESAQTSLLPVAPEGVRWTPISLEVTDPGLSFESLEELLRGAGQVKTATSFWIGDAILFAEARYGERYAQAMEASGLTYATLSNYVYVCRQIPRGRRRKAYEEGRWTELRFGHFEAVARLEPPAQDRWLDEASAKGWTRDDLRDALKTAAALPPVGGATSNGSSLAPAKVPARQEVLEGAAVVDAGRDLAVVHEALSMTRDALGGETVVGLEERLPAAFRALEEVGATVRVAAAKMAAPSLLEAARTLVKAASHSGGFAMIPDADFEAFRAAVDLEAP